MPPFVAVLRRWRPLLAGIHELAPPDGSNPLKVDDHPLAADTVPIEVIEASLFEADCHLIDIHVQISCLRLSAINHY